jgi:hypothetical protein
MSQPDHTQIMQVGLGFWASKTLLSAVELELFTFLAGKQHTGAEIEKSLGLHPRATFDFLDTLVALGFLLRDGDGRSAHYRNSPDAETFLVKSDARYIGGILEMANARLYGFWKDLTSALKTAQPQNEVKHTGKAMFEELYANPAGLEVFMEGMVGLSKANFEAFAQKFDFEPYKTLCDVGGATGQLSMAVAKQHAHLTCTSFDLPVVEPIAKRYIAAAGLSQRIATASGDFFNGKLPKADLITMGMILHDWNLEKKMFLLRQVYDALPSGGAFVAIENIIDDARRQNTFGLMMSLNMLIEFGDAFDFTGADFHGWCREVGFARTEVVHLAGPCSAAVAYKA